MKFKKFSRLETPRDAHLMAGMDGMKREAMTERVSSLSDERMKNVWNVRGLDHSENELADFDKLISSAVARCLREDEDNREAQAEHLSYLLGESVSVDMLNAYASEARREHKVPASRFLVLIAMTRRFDILDAVLREIGGKALNSQQSKVFRVGVEYAHTLNADRALTASLADVIPPA